MCLLNISLLRYLLCSEPIASWFDLMFSCSCTGRLEHDFLFFMPLMIYGPLSYFNLVCPSFGLTGYSLFSSFSCRGHSIYLPYKFSSRLLTLHVFGGRKRITVNVYMFCKLLLSVFFFFFFPHIILHLIIQRVYFFIFPSHGHNFSFL